jgi:hypothetical protein
MVPCNILCCPYRAKWVVGNLFSQPAGLGYDILALWAGRKIKTMESLRTDPSRSFGVTNGVIGVLMVGFPGINP